ncbi:formate dehydrogenase [Tamilnaduibacter salinus]|uniref:NADH-quinone oxidoreductase subunit F n=1 Tax=Tamilnaduibacter salinus TaxID=1484056 RepID=A0A2A2I6I4_9GAMM|nr:formate dehydrogenase beta subunit [Tamilnaduibacter salinus]PAV27267.1 formate dehydrogenase [Tamilnaduibacter salinus]
MTTVYVPRDTTALALEADAVAERLQTGAAHRGQPVDLVRNGSRGLFWLEPLVEVDTPDGRMAYGPVTPDDVPGLLDAGMLGGQPDHPLCQGLTESIPYLRDQQRLTFARTGVIDPVSLEDYRASGGWQGLEEALAMTPEAIVAAVTESGLRGRGGAAFPAGTKWRTVLEADPERPGSHWSGQKFIACNADEGDAGTFADRMLMEGDPYCLIEGMVIAGLAVGATRGFIYLRSEYPNAAGILNEALQRAESAGYLGDSVCGSGRAFHLSVRLGAGAYICGEETSMLDSLEGKRGMVRVKPPLPAHRGLFGQPTVINNVLTLASVPFILREGARSYADYGMGRSRGTQPFQLAGNISRGGLVELAFGVTLRTLLEDFGGGTASGARMRAVQVGGPLGSYLPESHWDEPMDYEGFSEVGGMIGHGGIVVFDESVDMAAQARFAMHFCEDESCGKCTPCRIGAVRGVEVIDRIIANQERDANLTLLDDLCETMEQGSLCAMGGMTPNPVRSALQHFPEDFQRPAPTAHAGGG